MVSGERAILRTRPECVVFVGDRLDWIWTSQVLGFEPVIIHVRHTNNPLVPLIQRLFPKATVVVGGYGTLVSMALPSVAFVHGHAGAFAFLFDRVDIILSTKGRRGRLPEHWQLSKACTSHAAVGGVTNAKDHCFLWVRRAGETQHPEEVLVPKALARDVHSVVSDTVAGRACAALKPVRLAVPSVHELRPGVYHGGGLLPVDQPNGQFIVRSVYTPTRWCRRRLTKPELATAFDIPHAVIQACRPAELCALITHPSRGLEHCARSLLAHAGVIGRGGKFMFKRPEGKESKRTEGNESMTLATEATGITTDVDRNKRDEERATFDVGSKIRGSDIFSGVPQPDESPQDRAKDQTKLGFTKEEPTAAPPTKDQNDTRDLKAVKADDAAIPVWLWNDAIRQGLTVDPTTRGHSVEAVDGALDVLRGFLLRRRFKLMVTRSFFDYLREEYPDLVKPDRIEVQARLLTPEEKEDSDCGFVMKYTWRPKFGRVCYKSWYNNFWSQARAHKDPGYDAIWRTGKSSWWDWDAGSAPFYWRWPGQYRDTIRDGLEIWFSGEKPQFKRPQRQEKNETVRRQVVEKIAKVRKRKYISAGYVWSLTDFFCVPKGDHDIRMVYNGTSSGLNDALWVPSFPLPTVDSLLRAVHPGTWMADTDLGEMFLNFVLHSSLRELAGVDVTHFRGSWEKQDGLCWERWTRCAMGLKPSPYQTTQAMLFAEDVIRGDPEAEGNVFRWDSVRLNLPGSETYDPSLPWVYKVRKDGSPAADFFFYVDDNRTTGNSEEEAWLAARRVASVCSYLGIQDAARKRRKASKNPGAWAGAVVSTDDDGVYVSVSQEKWDKAQEMIKLTSDECRDNEEWLERKMLERRRGFLLYVTRTFPSMVPYLKGFHLTLDGWRGGRNDDGWKYLSKEVREAVEQGLGTEHDEPENAPVRVKAKPRLTTCDLPALTRLFSAEKPPKRLVRARKVAEVYYGFEDASKASKQPRKPGKLPEVFYGFGDASQDGFGFNIQKPDEDKLLYRFGQWCDEVSEESSNYRELLNLVVRLEELVEDGTLQGAEVFIFTDNSTAESVFYKGNSSSKMLFELMLRLRELEMKGDLKLHVIHVSGTRMQEEGADGSSRGDQSTGVMNGTHILEFVPLHQSALELSPLLKEWLKKCWPKERGKLEFLTPKDWFAHGTTSRNCVWAPAPAAAGAAGEMLSRAVHKHPASFHLFIAPRLMTAYWRRRVGRLADFSMELGAGSPAWPLGRHEPVLIFVCLPLSVHRPWKLRGTKFLVEYERKLRMLHKADSKGRGRILRQLLFKASRMEGMSESMVRRVLCYPDDKSLSNPASGR
jgi:hypothetical protein